MFSGFVGPSFLSCSVSGNIFASPTASQIFNAIKLCQLPNTPSKGTLIICGNYTGDILNAGLAITRATAAGYKVRFIPIGDDVAVGKKKGGKVGRRGLSGHVVGLKIACALADQGESLERVGDVMEYIAANSGTIAVAFDRYVFLTLWELQIPDCLQSCTPKQHHYGNTNPPTSNYRARSRLSWRARPSTDLARS